MINLLPPKEKEELLFEKNKKLIIVLGNVFLISLICLSLVLFSLHVYILGEINYQRIILDDTKKKYQTPDFLSFESIIQKYNASLVAIDTFYKKEIYFSDILKTISEIQRPKGVSITSIAINAMKENNLPASAKPKALSAGKTKVTISGMSDTRDDLLIFKSNIENNQKVTNVYFPPNSWIKPSDISFNLTFEI